MENKFVYRRINPHDDEDIKKYLAIQQGLDNYLDSNVSPFNEERLKWLRIRMGATEFLDYPEGRDKKLNERLENCADEVGYFCLLGEEVVGYTFVCNYHVVNGERPNDDIGIICEIFVKDDYRNGSIAFNLLTLAIDTLLSAGKTSAIMTVQEDNPNRFLHFAIADKLLATSECKRKSGSTTKSYDLLISDLNKVKAMTSREIASKAIKLRKEYAKNNLDEENFND